MPRRPPAAPPAAGSSALHGPAPAALYQDDLDPYADHYDGHLDDHDDDDHAPLLSRDHHHYGYDTRAAPSAHPPPPPQPGHWPPMSNGSSLQLDDGDDDVAAPRIEKWLPAPLTASNTLFQAEHHAADHDDVYRDLMPDRADDDALPPPNEAPAPPFWKPKLLPGTLPQHDAFWAVLYVVCLAVMVVMGIALLFSAPPSSPPTAVPQSGLLLAIRDALPVLISVFLISCVLGALWILLMGAFVHVIVWATVLFIPVSCVGLTAWSLALLLAPPSGAAPVDQAAFLVLLLLTTVVTGSVFAVVTYLHKDHIDVTIALIQLATHVLRANPSVFILSLGLLAGYLAFVILWLAMIARYISWATVLAALQYVGDSASADTWVAGLHWAPTLIFLVVMLIWTTALVANLHKMALASMVHHWYFSRGKGPHVAGSELAKRALRRTATELVGTAALGALVTTGIQVARGVYRVYDAHVRDRLPRLASAEGGGVQHPVVMAGATCVACVTHWVAPLARYLARLVAVVNHYTLIYAAITGLGYATSAKKVSGLLARNVSTALLRDMFARMVLLLGNAILATIVGLGIVTAVRDDPALDGGAKAGKGGTAAVMACGMWIAWGVMRVWADVLAHVIDAAFLCFAIDVEIRECHVPEAHEAFAAFRY
ncbi:hypothetical protein GGF32_001182 [Allomyces javanicus]|nr:hypothetical protein GGF32_001182 [Allomyces javanicus]